MGTRTIVLLVLCCWWTPPASCAEASISLASNNYRSMAFDHYEERCVDGVFDEFAAEAGWEALLDLGYKPTRIYTLSIYLREDCLGVPFSEAILAVERQQAEVGFRAKLRRMSKGDLYAARIGYGVGGGVCLGVGFALLGAVGITAAMNDTFDREFGSYANSWSPYTIVGMIISGTAGLIMIPIGAGLLGKATAASREFDRREYGARVSVAPWPGGLAISIEW